MWSAAGARRSASGSVSRGKTTQHCAMPQPAPKPTARCEEGSNTMTAILVVEDERVAAKNIEEALLSMGYEVLGCPASADECIRRAGERRPDLVLMDVRIQGEMDGIQT